MTLTIKIEGGCGCFSMECDVGGPACVFDTPKFIGSIVNEALKGYEQMVEIDDLKQQEQSK